MRMVAIILLFMVGCNSAKQNASISTSADPEQLDGNWELNYISGPRIAFSGLYPDKKPTLVITPEDKRVSGNASCNSYSAPLALDSFNIRIGDQIAATKMFCGGEGENVFLNTLKRVDHWNVSTNGKTLNLLIGEAPMMRFTKK